MRCPYCTYADTKVVDSRDTNDLKITRRRRQCLRCGKRFTTHEAVVTADIMVIKKDGRRERFDREKLMRGILRACEKRPISRETIEKIVDSIESALRRSEKDEIESRVIGNMVMNKLKKLDKVAYIRFASVYLSFNDIHAFEDVLKKLK
ncbi:MAG: transcriptional regulator NrdR [Candidatus Micrarchaeia archaeon]